MYPFRNTFPNKHVPINLTNIRVASPCPADWEKMIGNERIRHCADCNLNVYNLSAMTERQVQELIEDSRGKRLCTRFYRRADGTVLTKDCPWNLRALRRRASRTAAVIMATMMSIGVGFGKNNSQKSPSQQAANRRSPSRNLDYGIGSTRRPCSRGRSASH